MNKLHQKIVSTLRFAGSSDLNDFTVSELISVLNAADDLYFNDEQPLLEDVEYDTLRLFVKNIDPTNTYFLGVGSDVRGGKVKLPFAMGSLDQIEIGEIQSWVSDWTLNDETVVVTDKLDGVSALLIYDTAGKLQIAYSRGNGVEGADITRHIKKLNIPTNIETNGVSFAVRGELIISKQNFEDNRNVLISRYGKTYKNARNCIAGLMNAKQNDSRVYKIIDFIAYEIVASEKSKKQQLAILSNNKFNIPAYSEFQGNDLTDQMLAKYIETRRQLSAYEIDGIVIDVDDGDKRLEMNPTRETLNPAYAIKYKVADASNFAIATVTGITWNVSKHGYLKPVINVEPVELVGVTVSKCTGFNAKFVYDNKIQPGCKIRITRSGDVIPFCLGVEQPGPLT